MATVFNLSKERFFSILAKLFTLGRVESRNERTDDDTRSHKFGYIIERKGFELARYHEGQTPRSFELSVNQSIDEGAIFVSTRREITLIWDDRTYICTGYRLEYIEEDDRTYLVICDPEEYDPEKDRLVWAVGRSAPIIVRGSL